MESYDFLGNLPELHYISLYEMEGGKNIVSDESLLPNACFIKFYDDDYVRFEHGEGYEQY